MYEKIINIRGVNLYVAIYSKKWFEYFVYYYKCASVLILINIYIFLNFIV